MASVKLPQTQFSPLSLSKPKDQSDLILNVLGQNPLAAGIDQVAPQITQALAKRAELRRQAGQVSAVQQAFPEYQLPPDVQTPELALSIIKHKTEQAKAENKIKTAKPIVPVWQDPSSGRLSAIAQKGWIQRNVPEATATTLLSTSYNQEANRNKLTTSTRSSAEFANTIIPHIDEMRRLIQDADEKGFIGPASGRIYNEYLAGKVGSTGDADADATLGKLRAYDSLLKSGTLRVHFGSRGGTQMYDHFSDMLNTGKQSAGVLNGSLDAIESFMQGYADAGKSQGKQSLKPIDSKKATLRWNQSTGKVEPIQ